MGKIHSMELKGTITSVEVIAEYISDADSVILVHSISMGEESRNNVGGQRAVLEINTYTASGTGAALPSPQKLEVGEFITPSLLRKRNLTVEGTGKVVKFRKSFWTHQGFLWEFQPGRMPIFSPNQVWGIKVAIAPTKDLILSGTVIMETIGG